MKKIFYIIVSYILFLESSFAAGSTGILGNSITEEKIRN